MHSIQELVNHSSFVLFLSLTVWGSLDEIVPGCPDRSDIYMDMTANLTCGEQYSWR